MDVFEDINGVEHSTLSTDGVEEKVNIVSKKVVGYVATFGGEPQCDISKETYEVLKDLFKC